MVPGLMPGPNPRRLLQPRGLGHLDALGGGWDLGPTRHRAISCTCFCQVQPLQLKVRINTGDSNN